MLKDLFVVPAKELVLRITAILFLITILPISMLMAVVGMAIYGEEKWTEIAAKISNTKFSWGVISLLFPPEWIAAYRAKKVVQQEFEKGLNEFFA